MGLPIVDISFKQLSSTAVARSERGIVALILKDAADLVVSVTGKADIPTTLSAQNQKYVNDTLKGNVSSPNKVIVYSVGTESTLEDALTYFESQQFNLLCMPEAETADKTQIKSFIQKLNDVVKYKTDAILANDAADYEGIYNYTAKNIVVGEASVSTGAHTARIAGLIEGTPLSQSVTYATLDDVDSIETLTKEEADSRIVAGELILVREMGKNRIARGVTSLTSLTDTKGDVFQKIKLRKITNLIHNDIRLVLVEKFIGKVPNNYDNKCVLITDIKQYLEDLAKEQLIENAISVELDLEAQKKWLRENTQLDVANMKEQDIKEANTKDNVFIAIDIKLVDAMENIKIAIAI